MNFRNLSGTTKDSFQIGNSGPKLVKTSSTVLSLTDNNDNPISLDSVAIHTDKSGEINAVTEKTALLAADILLIEDSGASYAKKKILLSSLARRWPFDKVWTVDPTDPDADYSSLFTAMAAADGVTPTAILVAPGTYTYTTTPLDLKVNTTLIGMGRREEVIIKKVATGASFGFKPWDKSAMYNVTIMTEVTAGTGPTFNMFIPAGTITMSNCIIKILFTSSPASGTFTGMALSGTAIMKAANCDLIIEQPNGTSSTGILALSTASSAAGNSFRNCLFEFTGTGSANAYVVSNGVTALRLHGCEVINPVGRSINRVSGSVYLSGGTRLVGTFTGDTDIDTETAVIKDAYGVVTTDGRGTKPYKIPLRSVAGDVATPADGDVWYNSSITKFRGRENGVSVNLRTDDSAIHEDVSAEISVVTEKTIPINGDVILIEDSAASYAKKRVLLNNLRASYRYIRTITSSETLTLNDDVILADATSASLDATLPTAVGCAGKCYVVKKVNSDIAKTVTVKCNGAQTIDGTTTQIISAQWVALEVISDGANWLII